MQLTKISSQQVERPLSYIELFKAQPRGKYVDASGKSVTLIEDFPPNALALTVEDEQGTPKEIAVDFQGDELILAEEERKSMSSGLLKHLGLIGRAMFAPDSQGNFVDSSRGLFEQDVTEIIEPSTRVWIDGNGCFVACSPDTSIKKSDLAFVQDSYGATIRLSSGAKVENSYFVTVSESCGAQLRSSSWSKVELRSQASRVKNSEHVTMKESPEVTIEDSPGAKTTWCTNVRVINSPGISIDGEEDVFFIKGRQRE